MLIHQYDSETGQYVSSRLADADPLNPARWLIPAFTTPLALPERARTTWPFFRNGEWILLPDYRGILLYRQNNGERAEVLAAGLTPADVGLTEQPRPTAQHRWTSDGWELDPAVVAAHARDAAMAEFEMRLEHARACNAGKADAYATGQLSPLEVAIFKAWAAYQLELVRAIQSPGFPESHAWPAEPDEEAIAIEVAAEVEPEITPEAAVDLVSHDGRAPHEPPATAPGADVLAPNP